MNAANYQQFKLQPEPATGPIFDEDHFVRQTFGDRGLQTEIIQLFIAQIADSQKALAAPMTTTAWRFMTHTLKGAAAAVGAIRMAEMASAWELAGSPQTAAVRLAFVQQFEAETLAFIGAVHHYKA